MVEIKTLWPMFVWRTELNVLIVDGCRSGISDITQQVKHHFIWQMGYLVGLLTFYWVIYYSCPWVQDESSETWICRTGGFWYEKYSLTCIFLNFKARDWSVIMKTLFILLKNIYINSKSNVVTDKRTRVLCLSSQLLSLKNEQLQWRPAANTVTLAR